MAKIIYGVAGEGFGHSSRSHLIGQRLLDAGHDVMFVGYKKSLVYLKQYFGERVRETFGLGFAYKNGRIDKSETLKRNLLNLPEGNRQNDELFKKYFEPFGPELVISDFEPFSAWWAWRNRVPFVSIDHEHLLTLCELEHRRKNWFSRLTSSIVTKCYYVGAVAYVIINFFETPLRIDSAVLAPPVVRPVVTGLSASEGSHVLLYSTTGKDAERLEGILAKFGRQTFYIYGFDRTGRSGNCVFKERSTEAFLADLVACRGVIASAGFSLISECLYFKKKMLVLPIAGQYEQIINAHYIEKLGLGLSCERLDESAVARFLDELDKPMPSDERILWPDNERFFQILQEQLNKLDKPVSLTAS
ncbi:MAG: glycosyltransferase family protein [Planctomycetota bacterium]